MNTSITDIETTEDTTKIIAADALPISDSGENPNNQR
ncbi:MAG: hypothetical protein RLZZ495_544, partial [Pseudomonadota bacterium]